jgi:serine protease Do
MKLQFLFYFPEIFHIFIQTIKEDLMRQGTRGTLIISALISIMFCFTGFIGCKDKKSVTEFVGFPESFADLAERVTPAVVNIRIEKTVRVPGSPPFSHFYNRESSPFDDFFRRFFGGQPDREFKQRSLGSGFIIDKEGFIITNNHVVERAEEITLKLLDGREFDAKVVGRDPKTDLAVIKISSHFKDLPVLPLGDSDKIRVGDWVLAVGNPFGLEHTITQGIISARGRAIGAGPYDNFLQTDAPINPGNSGGPLVDLKGEVIGINSAIIASGQGIGFAIPINMAKSVISQIKETGKVTRGWIGVSIQAVTPEIAKAFGVKDTGGALVGDVIEGGPADSAGIERGDIIISFNGKKVQSMSDLPRIVAETPVGKDAEVTIIRDGKEITIEIPVAEMTEEKMVSPLLPKNEKLGLTIDDINLQHAQELNIKDRTGVIVTDIEPNSLSEEAGIEAGDIIKEVNRTPVKNRKDYEAIMKKAGKESSVLFLIKRGSQTFYVTVMTS